MFHIDFNGKMDEPGGEGVLNGKVSEWEEEYGVTRNYANVGSRFAVVLRQAHELTGRRCVVLVDEYDKPILDSLDTRRETTVNGERMLLEDRNREVLWGGLLDVQGGG